MNEPNKKQNLLFLFHREDIDWFEKISSVIKSHPLFADSSIVYNYDFDDENFVLKQIEDNIYSSNAVILLISNKFLEISENILEPIKQAENKGWTVFPILLHPSNYEKSPFAQKLGAMPRSIKPLSSIKDDKQLNNEIHRIVEGMAHRLSDETTSNQTQQTSSSSQQDFKDSDEENTIPLEQWNSLSLLSPTAMVIRKRAFQMMKSSSKNIPLSTSLLLFSFY